MPPSHIIGGRAPHYVETGHRACGRAMRRAATAVSGTPRALGGRQALVGSVGASSVFSAALGTGHASDVWGGGCRDGGVLPCFVRRTWAQYPCVRTRECVGGELSEMDSGRERLRQRECINRGVFVGCDRWCVCCRKGWWQLHLAWAAAVAAIPPGKCASRVSVGSCGGVGRPSHACHHAARVRPPRREH